jgi:uncharacterized membrane protein YgdD (TMEM256/DUF423 family)
VKIDAVRIGAVLAALAVAAGAFGAHGLRTMLDPAALTTFETAARYHMYHALALVATGIVGRTHSGKAARFAAWSFVAGVLLFSGSLYVLALTGIRVLGAVAPIGGAAFITGWCLLAIAAGHARPAMNRREPVSD